MSRGALLVSLFFVFSGKCKRQAALCRPHSVARTFCGLFQVYWDVKIIFTGLAAIVYQ